MAVDSGVTSAASRMDPAMHADPHSAPLAACPPQDLPAVLLPLRIPGAQEIKCVVPVLINGVDVSTAIKK
eukprot:CAMPEP_0179277546 /NCGR_PEP_ID=MMETSP0797-20121207/35150_1 /TAXON_ID=47934 /ORGANISM="Dinophysis acuminata, Strain DAEP01" /LENGTH=69 /DNA_ID=CAMNT_0020986139 /DNA_START=256 /DNA_END=465 /DNA_ORIENTATION=+